MNLASYIERAPKVDLHSHLVGSMRPSTLEELAAAAGARLPRPAGQLYPYESFYEFIDIYNLATTLMRRREDFARVIYEVLEDALSSSNQIHTEMFFNPQYSMQLGIPYARVVDGLCDGVREARRRLGVTCLLIPSIGRELGERSASEMLAEVLAHRRDEVVGLGMDGPERAGPPERFTAVYQLAGRAGLKRTAHVCEDNQTLEEAPPSNFEVCLDVLGCDRFDHGYNILASADVTRRARDADKAFTTVALTSAPHRLAKRWHSIRTMVNEGLKVTVNTDNAAMFGTDLSQSFVQVCTHCGWSTTEVRILCMAAVNASWLDADEKRRLVTRFQSEFEKLEGAPDQPAIPGDGQ